MSLRTVIEINHDHLPELSTMSRDDLANAIRAACAPESRPKGELEGGLIRRIAGRRAGQEMRVVIDGAAEFMESRR